MANWSYAVRKTTAGIRSGVRRRITSKPSIPGIWMSRKTTSGLTASSAARTSAPFRHSPARANSGNAASNCRTPRRAAGSSSATSAFHSPLGNGGLQRKLAIRNANGGDGTAGRAARDREQPALAVQRAQALARVLDAVAFEAHAGVEAGAVVDDRQLERVAVPARTHDHLAGIGTLGDAVADGVLDQMLQREARHGGGEPRVTDLEARAEPVGEARLLDAEVLADQIELVLEAHFVRAVAAQRTAEYVAELLDDPRRGGALTVAHQHADGVERVEEKVRIDLRLQRGEARLSQLFRALARLDEPADGVLRPDDSEIDRHAKRKSDE